jgi:hypothetical protein
MSSTCGCCGSPVAPTPVQNRPGLDRVELRIGTHPTFFAEMRARLSSADRPALAGLTTHDPSDPSIALLDAWAAVGDVLSFYQERIGNEGYLRTATERRSLMEQSRLVGYRPRPGVAASVYLAYTIDPSSGPVEIPAGSRVNSVPGPGEQMQAFETSDAIEARHEWNQLGVRQSQPQTGVSILGDGLFLAGTETGLRVGDPLLVDLALGGGLTPYRIRTVEPDHVADRTRVSLETWEGENPALALLGSVARTVSDVARFGVEPGGATARRVLTSLEALRRRYDENDVGAAAAAASATLRLVSAELEAARRHDWVRLIPWLEEAVAQLGVASRLGGLADTSSAVGSRAAERSDEDLGGLLDELAKPPSTPPRGSRQLDRSVEGTFAGNADIYPALLTTMRPAVKDALYGALAHAEATPASQIQVYALREAAPLFGHNAPLEPQYSKGVLTGFREWTPQRDESGDIAYLDRDRPSILAGGPALVTRPAHLHFGKTVLTRILSADSSSREAYGLTGKTTVLQFADDWWSPPNDDETSDKFDQFDILRAATVHCGSELLPLAEAPIATDVCDVEVELDGLYDGLRSGRWMVLAGERSDVPGTSGVRAAELVMLAGVSQRVRTVPAGEESGSEEEPLPGDALHTFVTFAEPLAYCYRRQSVVLHGNVVHATHGETRTEVLGGGDPRRSLQEFTLRQPPLTWVSAPTVSGIASSLQLRVGEVAWHEARSLVELGPASRGFLTRQDDAGATSVTFGNGVHGARLPTGSDNVRATYRNGIGKPGNVAAGQISLLATKPLGVKEVVNPLRASGGADPDDRDQIRKNAPLAVLSLDRLVSTVDYADFARTFAGVAKASAARLSDGSRQLVHVTIAGVDDIPIDLGSDLHRNLTMALYRFGDPHLPLRVEVRELLTLVVSAHVKVLPDYAWDLVEPQVRARLIDTLGFARRELGQDVLPSEVIAAMQAVPGVDYVDLDFLRAVTEEDVVRQLSSQTAANQGATSSGRSPLPPAIGDRSPRRALPAPVVVWPARIVDGAIARAQLAYLQPSIPDTLILNEVAA